jgi:undecaprenyl-diphosphatase
MTLLQSIILGIIQGATEFIPISSSGHIVLTPFFLQWEIPEYDAFIFNLLLQVATLLAVFVYFWNDLVKILRAILLGIRERRPFQDQQACLGWYLLLATIPAGVIGYLLNGFFEGLFSNPLATGVFLMGTALLLVAAERVGKRVRSLEDLQWQDALWIGVFQVLALFPGISRSGSTITAGMTRDLDRPAAARFSFLMSIPILLATGLLATIKLFHLPNFSALLPNYLIGFITATVVGYLSIRWLLHFLSRRSLYYFAAYCAAVGIITVIVSTA